MKTIVLKGIAWDHPRGYEPLRATSTEFTRDYPEVQVQWHIRSLKEFGDMPVEDLIHTYDLLTIDHPYMGQAHKNKLLVPLETHLPEQDLEELENQSVGPSYRSYQYQGHQYALPIDAAALVAASSEDIILKQGLSVPPTREALLDFYKKLPKGLSVAWPLCPTDLWCSFLTLCAQDAGRHFIQKDAIDVKTGTAVLDELKLHLGYLHQESLHWNPIQVLDQMSKEEDIAYAPFLFGYTNYSREGYAKGLIRFGNSPMNPETDVSTILGGVGLAVSSKSEHISLAVSYVHFVASAKTQKGTYTKNGGQPGNLVAWECARNNVLCGNFFDETRITMEQAYVRPRHAGWNKFQEQGAELLHQGLVKDISSAKTMKALNQLYRSIFHDEERL
ncbi:MAG: extracellular solute-binding protein [Bacteroidota bacterium]